MKKAEIGSWSILGHIIETKEESINLKHCTTPEKLVSQVEAVELCDF